MPLMGRRMGRPGLLGMAARTAVVAGTATAVSHKMQTKYATKEEEAQAQQQAAYDQGQAAAQQQQAPPPPAPAAPAPAASGTESMIDQLKELASLKDQGILTEEEFAQQKAKLLGS
jgi:hypothetical protein